MNPNLNQCLHVKRLVVATIYSNIFRYCSYLFSLQGVDLNPRDREKCTPLLLAAAHGCSAVVSLLLESGADVTCEDEKKRTALHWAVGQDRTIERLLKVKLNAFENTFFDKLFTYASYICDI